MKVLEVTRLTKRFGGITALGGVSFSLSDAEIVGLIGPNGAGKTTLFDVITGFYRADAGSVKFLGQEISGMRPYKIARLGVGRTFQLIRLFPKMTVLENLMVSRTRIEAEKLLYGLVQPKSLLGEEKLNTDRAYELLELVELKRHAHNPADTLSFGQQKLLEIARALAAEPKLLLLDEPAAGLNPKIAGKVLSVVKQLKKQGKTVMMIEHEMKAVKGICDRLIALDSGMKIAEGKPQNVVKNRRVLESYLGGK